MQRMDEGQRQQLLLMQQQQQQQQLRKQQQFQQMQQMQQQQQQQVAIPMNNPSMNTTMSPLTDSSLDLLDPTKRISPGAVIPSSGESDLNTKRVEIVSATSSVCEKESLSLNVMTKTRF